MNIRITVSKLLIAEDKREIVTEATVKEDTLLNYGIGMLFDHNGTDTQTFYIDIVPESEGPG